MPDLEQVPPAWQKSSYSVGNDACVELAAQGDDIAVRDSKDPEGAVLRFTRSETRAFILGVKAGEFDGLAL